MDVHVTPVNQMLQVLNNDQDLANGRLTLEAATHHVSNGRTIVLSLKVTFVLRTHENKIQLQVSSWKSNAGMSVQARLWQNILKRIRALANRSEVKYSMVPPGHISLRNPQENKVIIVC